MRLLVYGMLFMCVSITNIRQLSGRAAGRLLITVVRRVSSVALYYTALIVVLSVGAICLPGKLAVNIVGSAIAATEQPGDKQALRIAMLAAETRFDSNTMQLTPAGLQSLQKLIEQLDQYHEVLSIRIIGHTDNVGSIEFNQSLSQQRADTIRESFSGKYAGVHLVAIGVGESQPIAKNDTESGRERNRRVEIQVIARGYMPIPSSSASTNN